MDKRKVIIGLETAVHGGSLSIFENQLEMDFYIGSEKISKSENILNGLEKIFVKNNIGRDEIERICVSKGPGSLTGIRIGGALAIGIGHALQKEVFEISILDALRINNLSPRKAITALYIGASGIFYKKFSELENFETYQKFENEIFHLSLKEFVFKMPDFVEDYDVSIVLAENSVNFFEVERELYGENYFKNVNIEIIKGNFATIIAMAGSFLYASDNV